MKKYSFNILNALIIILWVFICLPLAASAAETGYLENVLLEKLSGKERIALLVSQQPVVSVESQTDGNLLIKLADIYVPENLRRTFGENELKNISRITPVQRALDGRQWAYLTVDLKQAVPYVVKQEGKNIYIDFNVAMLPEKQTAAVSRTAATNNGSSKRYTDKLISLDFQDADIKSVLRLMAEYGNISIVSGDDVKGNVTLTMRNVPWEQALDTILDINSLAKKQMGDVISVMTLEKKKKDEADKARSEDDQRKAEDQRKDREQKLMVEKGKLRQILIEAKIVEASESFTRNIGINWGFGNLQTVGAYGLGVSGGSSTLQTNSWRQGYPGRIAATDVASGTAKSLSMAAVNLPAAVASPTIGMVIGGSAAFLEMQLAALEENTTGKVISAPKLVTMDGVKATIKQGAEVPYITPGSANSPATVSFKEALLKLEVEPKVTDEGRISMKIKSSNDVPDWAKAVLNPEGNPPINKSEIDSTVTVQDGDTVVIGGVLKTQDDKTVSGLPWLQKIPVLGWLFKTDNTSKEKRQLLIFVTPKILHGSGLVENAEKVIN
ncbi:MAG TPA: secretin and TonB N-terminal domain-containing protein [Smithellaceae bacterium]|nr:secretin and TonB N-terminal domain-containing protein [Smithellaceae bacterium]